MAETGSAENAAGSAAETKATGTARINAGFGPDLYKRDDRPRAEVAAEAAVVGPLAEDLRELNELSVVSEVGADAVARAREHLEAARAILADKTSPGPFGTHYTSDGRSWAWGNAVVGLRNPIAVPITFTKSDDGAVVGDFHLRRGYEGPPGLTHGGVSALILDQLLGHTVAVNGAPGMTGTLTIKYRRPTPLGDLHAEGRIDRVEGVKAYAVGTISSGGTVCVEAEGVFILPRWARGADSAEAAGATEAPTGEH